MHLQNKLKLYTEYLFHLLELLLQIHTKPKRVIILFLFYSLSGMPAISFSCLDLFINPLLYKCI